MAIRRRAWLGAASLLGVAGLFEALRLTGAFDHRNAALAAQRSAWRATFMRLERLGEYVNGVGHIGHCTNVMVIKGVRVMTDPWFFDPAFGSLSHNPGPAALPEDVGLLHAIAISHAHADHFDRAALDRLDKTAQIIAATEGIARTARRLGYTQTHVLRPWDTLPLGKATLTAVPSEPDSEQVGFVLRNEAGADGIFFAADTTASDTLHEIRERMAPRLAILPVDGARVHPFARRTMDVAAAFEATRVLEVRRVMPSHDGVEHTDWLAERLSPRTSGASAAFAARIRRELPGVLCILPKPGDFVRA